MEKARIKYKWNENDSFIFIISWALHSHWNTVLATVFIEDFFQPVVVHVLAEVFDVDIGELFGFGAELGLSLLPGFKPPHEPEQYR